MRRDYTERIVGALRAAGVDAQMVSLGRGYSAYGGPWEVKACLHGLEGRVDVAGIAYACGEAEHSDVSGWPELIAEWVATRLRVEAGS